jgi:hypothetical protein
MNRSAEHLLGTLKTHWPRAERVLGAPLAIQELAPSGGRQKAVRFVGLVLEPGTMIWQPFARPCLLRVCLERLRSHNAEINCLPTSSVGFIRFL